MFLSCLMLTIESVEDHIFSNLEMPDMDMMYGLARCNGREARRLFQEHFPPAHSTFASIHQRLTETGSLSPQKIGKSGQPRLIRKFEFEENVLNEKENYPEKI